MPAKSELCRSIDVLRTDFAEFRKTNEEQHGQIMSAISEIKTLNAVCHEKSVGNEKRIDKMETQLFGALAFAGTAFIGVVGWVLGIWEKLSGK